MKALEELFREKDTLSHAYVIIGDKDVVTSALASHIESMAGPLYSAYDINVTAKDSFGIEDARRIQKIQSRKSVGGKKFFIITARVMTLEGQNALLKLLEDPTPHTHFFIVAEQEEMILPTIRSRAHVVAVHEKGKETDDRARLFIESNKADRLSFIKKIIEEKNRSEAVKLLKEVEVYIGGDELDKKRYDPKLVHDLIQARESVRKGEGSIKFFLEHIALIL